MKNKKGFTLIELIAVIVILSIILVIATISIQSFVTKGRSKSFDVLVNSFQDSAKTAYTECILKPTSDFCKTHDVPEYNEKVTVTLGELIDAEFSDILKNPWKTSEACDRNSTVTLTRKEDSQIVFDYKTCLICGSKNSCDENSGGSSSTPTPSPTATPTKKTLREMILEDNNLITDIPHLSLTYGDCTNYTSGSSNVCMIKDKKGLYSSTSTNSSNLTYYFRGDVENNYVKFANKLWRIVRINEDGTIRLILNNNIGDSSFASNYNDYSYMYYSNSLVKSIVDNWYNSNIGNNDSYNNKVASGNYFCEQARVTDYYGMYNTMHTSINHGNATMTRYDNYIPTFACSTDGNGKGILNSNIGLITYDEAVYAGFYASINQKQDNYLQDDDFYWTMSPAAIDDIDGTADVWIIYTNLSKKAVADYMPSYVSHSPLTGYIRPVINLKADTQATKDQNGYYVVD